MLPSMYNGPGGTDKKLLMFHTKLHYSWQISASCAESTR